MRLKKIMSLVLACAMALSLATVASAADTKVYYIEDYDSYGESINTLLDGRTAPETWAEDGSGYPSTDAVVSGLATAATTTKGIYNTTGHNGVPGNSGTVTNGKYTMFANHTVASTSGSITYFPTEIWDYMTNDGYTYVISYDRAWNNLRNTVVAENYQSKAAGRLFWTDSAKTTAGTGRIFYTRLTYTDGVAGVVHGASGQYNNNSHRTSMGAVTVGTEYKYAVGITKGIANGDYYMPKFTYARDGAATENLNANINGGTMYEVNQTMTNIGAFSLHESYASNSTIDNLRMYTIKTDDFKVYAAQTEDVALNTKTMRIYFSNIVSPATYTADTTAVVYADGVAMGEGTYSVGTLQNYIGDVGGEIYSYVDVTFESLEEGTTYTVEFPETITNEIGTTLASKNVATFVTKHPDIKVNSFTVTNAAGLVADGSVQGAKVVLENTTSANKSVALIYAVYTTAGQLADVVYVNDTVAAEKTAEYEAGVKLNAAGTLKAFVWDGMTSLKPYTGIQSAAITAAAE